jgi:predicted pyridoxine 5'-phosphate oxidase superfamily flavin-nucleotide-binding protein
MKESTMGILTDDMKRVVKEQRLGFVATVCADGTPNLSPKGTTAVWDDDHLLFADIQSPRTIANLRVNPAVEINVVDPLVRKGYRFKGKGRIITNGPVFEQTLEAYAKRGVVSKVRAVVLVNVEVALPLISPVYDSGVSEDEVRSQWESYWHALRHGTGGEASTGE